MLRQSRGARGARSRLRASTAGPDFDDEERPTWGRYDKRCVRLAWDSFWGSPPGSPPAFPVTSRRTIARVFALPAGQSALVIALGVLLVAMFAGTVRVLPLLLAPGVPPRIASPLARGVLGVSLETALFVAPPLGWALAAARLVERGEARALAALGIRPARIVASAWPAALVMAICTAFAAASWGQEAAAPGRLARQLVSDARLACARAQSAPLAVEVPMVGISWVCFPGEPPRAVGRPPFGGRSAFTADSIQLADDLRALRLDGLQLVIPTEGPTARLRVAEARIHGLAPLGRASNLSVAARTVLMGASALLIASLASLVVLGWSLRSRLMGAMVGASGPVAALLVFSTLERASSHPLAYLAVPAVGLAAVVAAARAARLLQR